MKAELESKTASEAYTLLRERSSRTGISSYCTVGTKFCSLRQNPQQTIQEYITKFDTLRTQYEAAGAKVDISVQMTLFVNGLQQQYSKEAFSELNKQKENPHMEALRQALIRYAAFEKNQQEIARTTSRVESTTIGGNQGQQAQGAVVCSTCKRHNHPPEDCWQLHPGKRPPPGMRPSRAVGRRFDEGSEEGAIREMPGEVGRQ
ncbi:hypothetical protein GJ744_001129 [Endocarpon pusillum]|uniref:Uncharacterized protein n=1 Tax=Endocarpon pusillum TaxID=364733 RepID=A0A8H7ADU0_9EURO|nr:hypothetical protein GJ744_001129 [Endocarpon pusillum]